MDQLSRRMFGQQMLGSLMAYGLIESLFDRNLLADSVKPIVQKWLVDLNTLSQDLKGQKVKDIDFQNKLEELYQRVDLAELIQFLDLDSLAKEVEYPEKGAASLGIDLTKVEGLPQKLV